LHKQLGLLHGSSSPSSAFSRRELNPIKLVRDPDQLDGWLSLTASALNQLGQSWSQGLLLCRTHRFLPQWWP